MGLDNIAVGWFNQMRSALGVLPPHLQEMADKRLTICSTCPQRGESICKVCGCHLKAKSKDPNSHCPLSKW